MRNLLVDRRDCTFSGDKALVEGSCNGYSAELATADRRGVQLDGPAGLEYTMNDTVKINVAKVFTVAFQEMMDASSVAPSIGELWQRFQDHLRRPCCAPRGSTGNSTTST